MSSATNASGTAPSVSSSVRAKTFLIQLLEMTNTMEASDSSNLAKLISLDVICNGTDRLIQTQDEFRIAGKPTQVDLGIHYTRTENVPSIRSHGLLSLLERTNGNVTAVQEHGSNFGDGIYSAADVRAYHGCYGDVGIIVARLLGDTKVYDKLADSQTSFDSVTAFRHQRKELAVLSSSRQCIPILQFDATQIEPESPLSAGNVALELYHAALHALVDQFFNEMPDASGPKLDSTLHTRVPPRVGTTARFLCKTIRYSKQPSDHWTLRSLGCDFVACNESTCHICLGDYSDSDYVRCTGCHHCFHESCIAQFTPVCPVCWKERGQGQLFGKMPSGTMRVQWSPADVCADYGTTGTIRIEYILPSDIQELYHPNPGVVFVGAHRTAYLPDTTQGHHLLHRLQYAFRHGLTFKVGTSMTSGNDNAVTWASIHHKTLRTGGPARHGFPDPHYFAQCHRELDALCVPVSTGTLLP